MFFICVGYGGSFVCLRTNYSYYPNGLATATGTVQATGRNSIEIFDELQKREVRFIYLDQREGFNKGDYIRIYYYPMGNFVQNIKRMTVLEYKKDGQNLGYISRE